jgi:RND family efflux transporter MFP subunit
MENSLEGRACNQRRLVERVQCPRKFAPSPVSVPRWPRRWRGNSHCRPARRCRSGGARRSRRSFGVASAALLGRRRELRGNRGEFGRAEAVLKQAEANFERTKKLAAEQAKSERELQEAEVALASARARHAAAAALHSTYAAKPSGGASAQAGIPALELRAPIAGVLTSVAAGVGEPVSADQVLFTVLNPETIWLEARVPEAAIVRLDSAKDALCEVPNDGGRLFSIAAEGGRLVFTGLEVDLAKRTVPLIYELNNTKPRLRIGQAVRLHVETARSEEAVAVPDSAIVEEGGQPVAFVQVSGETFEKRELKLGIRDGNFVQVLDGVKEGERVVTKGAYAIRLSSISGVIPAHGHAH